MRLILLLFLTLNLLNAQKIALLIGNQDYDKASLQLKNPINDIEAIEETLEGIGFEVELLKDASKREMEDALDDFYERAEEVEIALVYFSGHGLQVFDVDTDRVINYLLPIEANVKRLRDLKKLIRLDQVVSDSSSAKKAIVLIDACRENPLYDEIANIFRKHGTKSTSVSKGLGQIDFKTNDVLIAFATTSNSTANDGVGELSPYAKALSRNLQTSADISLVLRDVRDDVLVSTNHEQEPVIIKNTLSGKVCLSGDCGEVRIIVEVVEKDINGWMMWVIGGLVAIIFLIFKFFHKETHRVDSSTNNLEIVTIDGLMYQNQPFTKEYTWEEAKEYAKNLRLGGYDDWRLPTKDELNKLLTKKKTEGKNGEHYVRKEFIENMPKSSFFWTSESRDSSSAWFVYFYLGGDYWNRKADSFYALCVR